MIFSSNKNSINKRKIKIKEYDSANGYLIAETMPLVSDQYLAGHP